MKPTRQNLERRLEALEERHGTVPEEPLTIRIQYVDHLGKEISPATEWTTTRTTTDTGRELIVEWPVYNGSKSA
ncbi:hypothetical protein EON83_27730 [bacterium]|nr:MAG: hypothetical protein EON83_27730 [bacterium]